MPVLTRVYPYPAQGHADRPSDDDEVADVAIRACRSVAELYSDGLAALGLSSRFTELRLFFAHDPDLDGVRGVVEVDPASAGFEMGSVQVPTGFASRTPQARAYLMLEVVHGLVARLAVARGSDPAALESCRQHVLDHDLEYRWTSPSKAAPDRRLQACADFRLAPDGYGRVRLRLTRRDDGATVVSSDEALAFCTREGFRRAATSLRWHGTDRVSLVPYDWVPAVRGGTLAVSRGDDGWRSSVDDYMSVIGVPPGDPTLPELTVHVEGRGAGAAERPHEIGYVGGGPISWGFVDDFNEAFRAEMRRLTSPAGQAWWANSEIRICEIYTHYGDEAARVRARRTGDCLRVYVDQPASSPSGQDPATAARQVADEVVALVRRRTGLGPHPKFGSS